MIVVCLGACALGAVSAQTVPAGTTVEARLSIASGSLISHKGDVIEATVIAPVYADGGAVIPPGAVISGAVGEVNRLGLGLKHLTASLEYNFETLRLPNNQSIPVHLQLLEVETAKEHVDDKGIVRGIHPIAGVSSALAFFTVPLSFVSPVASVPVWLVKSMIAPSASPEIYFPGGTEIFLRFTRGVTIPISSRSGTNLAAISPSEVREIENSLHRFSRGRAYLGKRPSDWINVVFVGSRKELDRAFESAGWVAAQRKSPVAFCRVYLALTKRKGYPQAPMNTLTLDGSPSDLMYQKSLDTVEKRHHVRLWEDPEHRDVWLGAAAEDVGFEFKSAHWTHLSNPGTDAERAKVVDDLAFTKCVAAAGMLPGSPLAAAPNLRLASARWSDGEIATVRLNNCDHPEVMAGAGQAGVSREHGRTYRVLRSFRDDLIRSNIVFMAYNSWRALAKNRENRAHGTASETDLRNLNWVPSLHTGSGNASSAAARQEN